MARMRRLALTLAVLTLPLLAFQAPPKKDATKPATKPAATKPAATKGGTPAKAAPKPADATTAEAPAGPRVYVAPFKGIWGLDIHPELCQRFVDDIKAKKPDLIVFTLDSQDLKEGFYTAERNEDGTGFFDDDSQRRMLKLLDEELRGTPTMMWVQDSWGFSTLLALAFKDMYMKPGARLDGLGRIAERYSVEDPQVLAKFREAVVAIANGFLEVGGYDIKIGEAMMRPELKLSASWKGRDLVWTQDADGTWVVDGSEKGVAAFTADTAEDLGLADGSASDLGELMFLRGYREYQLVPSEQDPAMGAGERIGADWTKAWNRAFDQAEQLWTEAQSKLGLDAGKFTDLAKRNYEKIVDILEKNDAAYVKWRMTRHPDLNQLKDQIERWKQEQIARNKAKKDNQGGGGGSNRRGFGGGVGGG
jgi:alpha-ketoglutarate-dependent taurine dioxygenase